MLRLGLILSFWMACMLAPLPTLAAESGIAESVTTTRALPRGAILKARDVTGPFAEEDYVGQELIRAVRAGAILTPRHVRIPRLVKRNETVTLIFRQGALTMETMGRSLDEGALGDRVSVMNASSRKRIMGHVIGPGQVEVTP